MSDFDDALKCLEKKQFDKAREILEELHEDDLENVNILYNLGMCYTELNQTQQAIEVLNKCIELAPNYSNAYVALSFAYVKENNLLKAKEFLLKATEIDPNNSYALKNLGGLWGKLGDNMKALYFLKKSYNSNPNDPYTVYGLGVTCQDLGDLENAAVWFRKTLGMNSPPQIQELAKDWLREIAVKNLKSKGFRTDAVFYCLSAINFFKNKSVEEIKDISFEIGLKGRNGLDINDPQGKYQVIFMPGTFSGLQLVCYMYVGFKLIAPQKDIGIDLSEEYRTALRLVGERDREWDWN
jgi:tetratricopeptide (TPR) repeat protein